MRGMCSVLFQLDAQKHVAGAHEGAGVELLFR